MKYYLPIAIMFAVFATPLKAEPIEELQDKTQQEEQQHAVVGDRAPPHAEWIQNQENRARIAAHREALAQAEDEQMEEAIHQKRALPLNAEGDEETFEEVADSELVAKGIYQIWHPSAIQYPSAVTANGDVVTLHDGSEWIVKYNNRYKTLNWFANHRISILPNHAWFSSYYYRLVNHDTGADVEVNMLKGPIYNGIHTCSIDAIDYYNHELLLKDGSPKGTIWKVSSSEWATFKKWAVNDTIIIGINDSWFSSHPHILINVNMLNWAACGPAQHDYVLLPIITQ